MNQHIYFSHTENKRQSYKEIWQVSWQLPLAIPSLLAQGGVIFGISCGLEIQLSPVQLGAGDPNPSECFTLAWKDLVILMVDLFFNRKLILRLSVSTRNFHTNR